MRLLSFQLGDSIVELAVDRMKILLGSDSDTRYRILRSVERYFSGDTKSEYVETRLGDTAICLDGNPIGRRNGICFRLDPYFDMTADMKMGSASIMFRYAEAALRELPFDDAYTTAVASFCALGSESISEALSVGQGDATLSFGTGELTLRHTLKFIAPSLEKEDCEADPYSLSESEMIGLQARLISRIAEASPDRYVLVLYDGRLNADLLHMLGEIFGPSENIFCLISTESTHEPIELRNYAFFGREVADISDENVIEYGIGMELPWNLKEQEILEVLHEFISGKNTDKTAFLRRIL